MMTIGWADLYKNNPSQKKEWIGHIIDEFFLEIAFWLNIEPELHWLSTFMMLFAEFKIVDCGDSCNYTIDTIEFGSLGNCLVWLYAKAKWKEKCLQSWASVLERAQVGQGPVLLLLCLWPATDLF